MADRTSIEWTGTTWNPVTGCTKISDGCTNCYAQTFAERWRGIPGHHFENGFGIVLRPERLTLPQQWHKPRLVFVNSMSDLFHQAVPDAYIAQVFAVMALTPRHTYQVLTKRHGRMKALLSSPAFWQLAAEQGREHLTACQQDRLAASAMPGGKPLPNVWMGVSVEDQKTADMRIPALLETPASVRWISAEPLLGPIDLCGPVHPLGGRRRLTYWLTGRPGLGEARKTDSGLEMHPLVTGPRLDWVVAGGESGPGARPADPDWFRTLRDQCAHAGVPFLFKQWGSWAPSGHLVIRDRPVPGSVLVGSPVDDAGHRVEMRRMSKKAAGRQLDGRTHGDYPTPEPEPELTPEPEPDRSRTDMVR